MAVRTSPSFSLSFFWVLNRSFFVHQAAETGSGKTGAFGIPVLQIVYETLRGIATGNVSLSQGSFVTHLVLSIQSCPTLDASMRY
jgi:hypothetical protein